MHNIMEINGAHATFGVNQTPWHKLGKVLDHHLTSEQAIKEAKLDWQVVKLPSQYFNPLTNTYDHDKGNWDLICGANGKRLGIVSNSYKVFQNREAFEFCDTLVQASYNTAMYETAGALGNGEVIWMMLSTNKVITLGTNDTILPYFVLTNNHAGKGSLKAFFAPIRVVCQNTLTAAISSANNYVSIKHIGNLEENVKQAQIILGLAVTATESFAEKADKLTQKVFASEEQVKKYFKLVMFPAKEEVDMSTRSENIIDTLMNLFEGKGKGSNLETSKGTAWGAYNAVTQFLDYESSSAQNRPLVALKSNIEGAGYNTKTRAFQLALSVV